MSPISFLKPRLCNYQRMNRMGLKARERFHLSPARNHPSKSKRVLVHSRNVIVTRHVTWAHVPLVRPVIVQSKPSMEGNRNDWLQDRQASSVDERAKEDKIRSGVSSSSRDSCGGKSTPPQSISGRVTSPPDAGGLSAQSGSHESLSNASAISTANGSCGALSVCDENGAGKQSACPACG